MYGLSGVLAIVSGLAKGESLEQLELKELPNMPFLYWLAIASAIVKPKWTDEKTWPALKVNMSTPTPICPKRLSSFRKLVGWPEGSSSSAAGGGTVPGMFLMAESFKLVMQVLTLPAFPTSVMGTVVNKRAKYSYLRLVQDSERLTYSCSLNPTVGSTFSGHAEFELLLEAVSHDKGDVVWQAVLTLVLMNPRKGGKKKEGEAPKKQPEQDAAAGAAAAAGEAIAAWTLPENTGRAYAALDGDISPMHLYKATAMLMGFPSPVANVHFLAARTEATIDTTAAGESGPVAPLSIELEFKKPTLLPNKLTLSAAAAGSSFAKDAPTDAGFQVKLEDKKGKPIAAGSVNKKATRRVL